MEGDINNTGCKDFMPTSLRDLWYLLVEILEDLERSETWPKT